MLRLIELLRKEKKSERRCFEIQPQDLHFGQVSAKVRKVRFTLPHQQSEVQQVIRQTFKGSLQASYAASSETIHSTYMSYL